MARNPLADNPKVPLSCAVDLTPQTSSVGPLGTRHTLPARGSQVGVALARHRAVRTEVQPSTGPCSDRGAWLQKQWRRSPSEQLSELSCAVGRLCAGSRGSRGALFELVVALDGDQDGAHLVALRQHDLVQLALV